MQLVTSIGEIIARFNDMRISHPRADSIFDILDAMREGKRKSASGQQPAGSFFAESGYGKSTILTMYLERRVVDYCLEKGLFAKTKSREDILKEQRLVIYVSLPSSTTMKSLMTSLLVALGDPKPHAGSTDDKIHRADTLMRKLGVELLIIDEVDHLQLPLPRTNANREKASAAHNHLKNILLKGYPIMFVGIPESREKLFAEKQLARRERYKIKADVLKYTDQKDAELLREFCADLGIILQEKGIMREISDFLSGDILHCLYLAGGGLIGGIVGVVWKACEVAFAQGAPRVERDHLLEATEIYAIPTLISYNPFVHGARSLVPAIH